MHQIILELPSSPFHIKDLMLGEFLAQAGILDDAQQLRAATMARTLRITIASALCELGWLTTKELLIVRMLLNRYLADPDAVDDCLAAVRQALGCNSTNGCTALIQRQYAVSA